MLRAVLMRHDGSVYPAPLILTGIAIHSRRLDFRLESVLEMFIPIYYF